MIKKAIIEITSYEGGRIEAVFGGKPESMIEALTETILKDQKFQNIVMKSVIKVIDEEKRPKFIEDFLKN